MAESKKIKTRIQNKYDAVENWAKATNFKPLSGELIILDNPELRALAGVEDLTSIDSVPRIKIGDGSTSLPSLPFVGTPTLKRSETNNLLLVPGVSDALYLLDSSQAVNLLLFMDEQPCLSFKNFLDLDYFDYRLFVLLSNKKRSCDVVFKAQGKPLSNTYSTAASVFPFVRPDKCILNTWHTGNVIGSGASTVSTYACYDNETDSGSSLEDPYSTGTLTYTVSLPEDKDTSNNYIYNSGFVQIRIQGFFIKDSTGAVQECLLNITNDISLAKL